MRLSAIFAFICFASIVAILWCGVLDVLTWDASAAIAIAGWLVMGTLSAAISGRYDTRKPN